MTKRKICEICNFEHFRPKSLVCSNKCAKQKERNNKPFLEINCKICNLIILTKNSNIKFCSNNCKRLGGNLRVKKYQSKNSKKISDKKYINKVKTNKIYKKKVLRRVQCYQDRKKRPELYIQECCICGSNKNIEFHHPCYDFALSVYSLCKKHHGIIHSEVKV